MAARKNQPIEWHFYVYEILNSDNEVIYVGKGSSNRIKASLRQRGARMLISYYKAFKQLASKVDNYYSKELQDTFNALNMSKLYEVGYGAR